MNLLNFNLVLLGIISNFNLSKEQVNRSEKLNNTDKASDNLNVDKLNPTNARLKDQQTLIKQKGNCDHFNLNFLNYLIKNYNEDSERAGRMQRLCNNLEYTIAQCPIKLNNTLLFNLIKNSKNKLNADDFNLSRSLIKFCPLALFKAKQQTCIVTSKHFYENSSNSIQLDHPKPNSRQVWFFTFSFVTIISFCSLIGVVVMPFANNNSDAYKDAFNLFEGKCLK